MNTTTPFVIAGAALLGCLYTLPATAQGVSPPSANPPGLYVQVLDGMITVSNPSGVMNVGAGQFGLTSNVNRPPVLVPANPGIPFTPPVSFTYVAGTSPPGTGAGSKSNNVDCEVR